MPPRKNKKEAARRAQQQQGRIKGRIIEWHFLADMLFDQHESQMAVLKEQYELEILELKHKLAAREKEVQQLQLQLQKDKHRKPKKDRQF